MCVFFLFIQWMRFFYFLPFIFCFIKCNVNVNMNMNTLNMMFASNSYDNSAFSPTSLSMTTLSCCRQSPHLHNCRLEISAWRVFFLPFYHKKCILLIKWSYFRHKFKVFMLLCAFMFPIELCIYDDNEFNIIFLFGIFPHFFRCSKQQKEL